MQVQSLHGRTALVTGAGSGTGIGFAVARRLSAAGARVFLTSTTERCQERARQLVIEGGEAAAFPADLTSADQVDDLLTRLHSRFGPVSVLVNNAGMTSVLDPMGQTHPTHLVTDTDWVHGIERNLTSAFTLTARVLPDMVGLRWGRIVTVASTTGVTGAMFGEAAYAAAKAGLVGLTRTIALEYAGLGVTANAVAPGWIATGSQTPDEVRQGTVTPVGRSGTAEEVAHVIAMLTSPEASYITGQCLVVDGGNAIAEERAAR